MSENNFVLTLDCQYRQKKTTRKRTGTSDPFLARQPAAQTKLTIVQRENIVICKSSNASRIKNNFNIFELGQADFDSVEGIAAKAGQRRFCNLDELWG